MALPSGCPQSGWLLLRRGDHVLGGLGHAELDHRLGLDLDGLAGLGVAAHARLAIRLDQAADAGDYEYAVLLGFLDGGLRQQLQARGGLLVGDLQLLGHMPHQGCLGHSCCHAMFSF